MKKISFILSGITLLFFFSSCGISLTSIMNQNMNSTEVHLAGNNFKITGKATGSAEVSYVLIFGGVNKKRLYENAYGSMVNNAGLDSGSKALVNILTEEHVGGVPPFYYTRTVNVSANVIEFVR